MYDIFFNLGGGRLQLLPSFGYYVAHARGLTDMATEWARSVRQNAIGESVNNPVTSGRNITLEGYILDGNATARLNLLRAVPPQGRGTISVMGYTSETSRSRYSTDVVVVNTPIITHEKHAKFSFSLYAPNPFWRQNAVVTSLASYSAIPITVNGESDVEYTLNLTMTGAATQITLILDYGESDTKSMILEFASPLASGDRLQLTRNDGRLVLTVNGTDRIDAVSMSSDLWFLPRGEHTAKLQVIGGGVSTASLQFFPLWGGIICDK